MLPAIRMHSTSENKFMDGANQSHTAPVTPQWRDRFIPLLRQRGEIDPKPVGSPDLRALPQSAFIAPASAMAPAGAGKPISALRQAREFSEEDKRLLNQAMYYTRVDTETPSTEWVSHLPEGELKNFYIARHFEKKGTDVVDNYRAPDALVSASKETVPNRLQSGATALLRQAIGTAVVERAPGSMANFRHGAAAPQLRPSGPDADQSGVAVGHQHKMDLTTFHRNIIEKLSQTVPAWARNERPVVVHVVTQRRDPRAYDANTNYLAMGFQSSMIASLQNAEKIRQMDPHFTGPKVEFMGAYQPVVSRTVRSNASPMGRIIQQGVFGKGTLPEGSHVVFVDDHVQAGGALMAAYLSLKAEKANIVGVGSFGVHPLSANGLFDSRLQVFLQETLAEKDPDGKIAAKLKDAGIELSSLTNFEVFVLLSDLCDPAHPSEAGHIRSRMAECARGITLPVGQADAFASLLASPAATPEQICQQIDHELAQVPPCVDDTQISNVVFYDYDDTLVAEIDHVRAAFEALLTLPTADNGLGLSAKNAAQILGSEQLLATRFEAQGKSKFALLRVLIQENPMLAGRLAHRLTEIGQRYSAGSLEASVVDADQLARIDQFTAQLTNLKDVNGNAILSADLLDHLKRILKNPGLSQRFPKVADLMARAVGNNTTAVMPLMTVAKLLENYISSNKKLLETLSGDGLCGSSAIENQYAFAKRLYMRHYERKATDFASMAPEAIELLEATRTPETAVGLISNKKNIRLARQIAAGPAPQFFDAIQGLESILHQNGGVRAHLPQKPDVGMFDAQLECLALPTDFDGPIIGFGDKVSDGMALQGLREKGRDNLHFIYVGGQPLNEADWRNLSGVNVKIAQGGRLADRKIKAKEIYLALKS